MTASPLRAALNAAAGGNRRQLSEFTVLGDDDPFGLDSAARHLDDQCPLPILRREDLGERTGPIVADDVIE